MNSASPTTEHRSTGGREVAVPACVTSFNVSPDGDVTMPYRSFVELCAGYAPVRFAPEPARCQVAGDTLPTTLAQFEARADALLTEEQARPLPNNALVSFLCDAVRLARENDRLYRQPLTKDTQHGR